MTRTRPALILALLLSSVVSAVGGCRTGPDAEAPAGDAALAKAFADQARDLPVEGRGMVVRILKDDALGGRHQRFVVRLVSGQTLLIAHNIDVAARIDDLRVGDEVAFRGIYEWSSEGGTVHWTHHDPEGARAAGWISHAGRTYE